MTSSNPTKSPSLYYQSPLSSLQYERYLIPLQNQYSVLNQSHNPYDAVDNFAFEVGHRIQRQGRHAQSDSLRLEVEEWEKKQGQKDKENGQMMDKLKREVMKVKQLQKLKNCEYLLDRLNKESRSNQSVVVQRVPMFMPMWMQGQGCGCGCNCRNSCQKQHRISRQKRDRRSNQFVQQKILQNCAVGTDSLVQIPIKEPIFKQIAPTSSASISSQPLKHYSPPQMKPKTNLLRRFRKCALAIYFCFYFKWFSFQFSINRYSAFKKTYLLTSQNPVTAAYKEVYEKMLTMDLLKMLVDSGKQGAVTKSKEKPLDLSIFLKKENKVKLEKLSSFTVLNMNKELLFSRCAHFILNLVTSTQKCLKQWQWGIVGQALAVGSLNKSFAIDNTFLAQQIFLMVFHEEKGYMRVSPETQRIQLLIKLFVKLLLFNVCLQLDNNREWIDRHPTLNGLANQDELFIFLEISSKILFIVCQNLYQQLLVSKQTNYAELSDHFKIQPCNPLVYAHSIKRRRELFKNKDVEESDLLIYGLEGLDEINEVVREPFFEDSVQSIIEAVETCADEVLLKMKQDNRQLYARIWKETVQDEYLILRGIKKIMKNDKFYAYPTSKAVTIKDVAQQSNKSSGKNLSSSKNSQFSK